MDLSRNFRMVSGIAVSDEYRFRMSYSETYNPTKRLRISGMLLQRVVVIPLE